MVIFMDKMKKNTSYKALYCIIFMLCIVMLTPVLVSSADFDNTKNFDKNVGDYGKVTIKDWFGLLKLTDLELKKNTDTCSSDCSADIEIVMYQSGSLVEDIKFVGDEVKSYNISIKQGTKEIDVDDYEQQCSNKLIEGTKNNSMSNDCSLVKTGTHKETVDNYIPYQIGDEVSSGTYQIKLEGSKSSIAITDWQITSQGKLIDDWAIWGSSLQTDLLVYYKFDETGTDTIAVDSMDFVNGTGSNLGTGADWVAGALNNAVNLSRLNEQYFTLNTNDFAFGLQNFTYSFWMKSETASIQFLAGTDNADSGGYVIKFDGSYISIFNSAIGDSEFIASGLSGLTDNAFHHYVLVRDRDGVNSKVYIDNSNKAISYPVAVGNYNLASDTLFGCAGNGATVCLLPSNATYDETGIWNRSLTATEISDLYNGGTPLAFSDPDTVITLNSPVDYLNSSVSMIEHNATAVAGSGRTIANISLISNQSGTFVRTNSTTGLSGTTESYKYNLTYTDGIYDWYYEACDDAGDCYYSTTNRTITVDTTYPKITINLPTSLLGYGYAGKSENLSWSIVETNIDSYWYVYNETNTTLTNGLINSTTFTLGTSPYNITLWVNDSFGNTNSTYRNWTYTLIQTNESYPATIPEGSTGTFYINVTNAQASLTPYLIYDGTSYLGSCSQSSNQYSCSKGLSIPTVSADINKTFYWSFLMADTSIVNSTPHNVTVYNFAVDDCTTNTIKIFNISMKDEANNSAINVSNLEVELDFYSLSNVLIGEFNKQWSAINNVSICVGNLTNANYKVNMVAGFINESYVNEFYYIDQAPLNLSVTPYNLSFMDLLTADSTSFLFNYFDEDGLAVNNPIVHVWRKYIGEGIFREVERSKQNDDGNTIVHLVEEDVIYYFQVSQNNTVIYTSSTYTALCDTSPCTITLEASGGYQDFATDWDLVDDGAYSLTADAIVREVNLTFETATASTFNLTIYKIDSTGEYESIGSDQSTGTSGSLNVNIPVENGNVTFFAVVEKDDVYLQSVWVDMEEEASSYFGTTLAIFLGILIIMCLGLMAISEGSGTIIFVILGMFLTVTLGLIDYRTEVGFGLMIYFVITGGIIVWKLTRRNR